jgi:hypothetical protein
MRINWIILLTLFLGLTAFNLTTTFEPGNPSVKVSTEKDFISQQSGDIIKFSVEICSAENLESFNIEPDFLGEENTALKYHFNSNTKQASVIYFYTIPTGSEKREINFTFSLEDNSGIFNKSQKIRIK